MKNKFTEHPDHAEMRKVTMNTIARPAQREYASHSIRAYQSHVMHFRMDGGRLLPSTAQDIAEYLLEFSSTLAPTTLAQRLSALSKWHKEKGFEDPTKDPRIPQLMAHITNHSEHKATKATPLLITDLMRIDQHMLDQLGRRENFKRAGTENRLIRDRAMMLIAFWRGLTFTHLTDLKISDVIERDDRIIIASPTCAGDLASRKLPRRETLCPTTALHEWLQVRDSSQLNLFYGINRWGQSSNESAKRFTAAYALSGRCEEAGLCLPLNALSFRRGFEQWAKAAGWDIQTIREYTGIDGLSVRDISLIQRISADRIEFSLDEL